MQKGEEANSDLYGMEVDDDSQDLTNNLDDSEL